MIVDRHAASIPLRLTGAISALLRSPVRSLALPSTQEIGDVMRRRLLASLTATAAVAASLLIGSAVPATAADATAQSASATDARDSGGVTPNAKLKDTPIHVEETQFKIVATLRGTGKQVYDCIDGKYKLREPVATLSTLRGTPAGIHGKGPFWAHFDGSHVEGVTDPAPLSVPQPAPNVAWLKVTATNKAGTGVFSKVAFIQRLDTKGGVAPANCGAPTVAVDYSANYVFWAPK